MKERRGAPGLVGATSLLAVWLAAGCGEIREIQVAPANDTGTETSTDGITVGATSSSTAFEDTGPVDRDTGPIPEPTSASTTSDGTGSHGSSSGGPAVDPITECFDVDVMIPGASPQCVTTELTVDRTDVTIADLDVRIRVHHESAMALQLWLGRDGGEPVPLTLGNEECMQPFGGVFYFDPTHSSPGRWVRGDRLQRRRAAPAAGDSALSAPLGPRVTREKRRS